MMILAIGSVLCGLAAAKNVYDATHDSWRSIRVVSWASVPVWLAMAVMLGAFAFMEATPNE